MKGLIYFIFGVIIGFVLFLVISSGYFFSITGFSIRNSDFSSNRILPEDIVVFEDYIMIKVKNATISSYEPSFSMNPLIDSLSNGIRIVPKSESDIRIGDIVTFNSKGKLFVHRVIDLGYDKEGLYFITKGDRNLFSDEKIRFSDIKYVTIGVVW